MSIQRPILLSIVAATLFAAQLPAEIIPASQLVDWTPGVTVGVIGGIPTDRNHIIDVTKSPYNADATGATDASPAINAAITAAAPGDVIYLPSGRYLTNSSIYIATKQITLRGAGESTVIDCAATGQGIYMGSGSDYQWAQPATGNNITAGLAKGSTSITLADASAFAVGQLVQISIGNDPSFPVISVHGYDYMRRQMVRITGKSGNTLTIFPRLYSDYGSGRLTTRVNIARQSGVGIGLEDFVIDSANRTQYVIFGEQCYNSWIKNVHSKNAKNVHMYFANSLNMEIRHCFLDVVGNGGSPNGSGIMWNTCSGGLFEDNIIYKAFPLIEVNHGSSGNVFAYNFLLDSRPGAGLDTNHGPHNNFNLYEGNIAPNIQADGYYGTVSEDTVFRNWLTGQQIDGSHGFALILNRMARRYAVVGNLLGTTSSDLPYSFGNPNLGNGSYVGTAQPSTGRDWADLHVFGTLSTRTDDVTGVITYTSGAGQIPSDRYPIDVVWSNGGRFNLTALATSATTLTVGTGPSAGSFGQPMPAQGSSLQVWPGALGFQELDLDVEATTLRKANWQAATQQIPSSEVITETLPSSLYRSTKPAFFGSLNWPAFDPSRPVLRNDTIPAGYRYMNNGQDPSGVSSPTPPSTTPSTTQTPLNARIYRMIQ